MGELLLIEKLSDIFISVAYFLIPIEMAFFLWKKKLPIRLEFIAILFVIFIFSCGVSHISNTLNNVIFSLVIKIITAISSITTSISLFFIIPAFINIPELIFYIESENKELLNFRNVNNAIRKKLTEECIIKNVVFELNNIFPNNKIKIITKNNCDTSSFIIDINNELSLTGNNLNDEKKEFLKDISFQIKIALEQAKTINELKIANEKLLLSKKTEEEFLSLISHDIKSPLLSIISLLELLEPTEEQKKYTNLIYESGDLMFKLINKIIDVDKLKDGKIKLEYICFDLEEEMKKVLNIEKVNILKKKLHVNITFVPEYLDFNIIGDPLRFEQIVLNILSNAIKFSKENGSINIYIKQFYDFSSCKRRLIQINITDTGIGMSQETIDKIFESFTQSDISTARIYGGSGLGLFICKKLVSLMNGTINVKSEINVGTTFTVELPFEIVVK